MTVFDSRFRMTRGIKYTKNWKWLFSVKQRIKYDKEANFKDEKKLEYERVYVQMTRVRVDENYVLLEYWILKVEQKFPANHSASL